MCGFWLKYGRGSACKAAMTSGGGGPADADMTTECTRRICQQRFEILREKRVVSTCDEEMVIKSQTLMDERIRKLTTADCVEPGTTYTKLSQSCGANIS